MTQPPLRFDDGAAYERMMGVWSQKVGDIFLDWLTPATGQSLIDVGCGNSAFSELLIQNCAPAEIQGIDLSEGQLAFARTRLGARGAIFQQGDTIGFTPLEAPSVNAAPLEALHSLWTDAGLEGIETRTITMERSFADFDDFWTATTGTGILKPMLAPLDPPTIAQLQERVRARLPTDAQGRITYASRANAIKGSVTV